MIQIMRFAAPLCSVFHRSKRSSALPDQCRSSPQPELEHILHLLTCSLLCSTFLIVLWLGWLKPHVSTWSPKEIRLEEPLSSWRSLLQRAFISAPILRAERVCLGQHLTEPQTAVKSSWRLEQHLTRAWPSWEEFASLLKCSKTRY